MPVVLAEEDWTKWLGEAPVTAGEAEALMKPFPSQLMSLWPVSKRVGNIRNNDADLIMELTG